MTQMHPFRNYFLIYCASHVKKAQLMAKKQWGKHLTRIKTLDNEMFDWIQLRLSKSPYRFAASIAQNLSLSGTNSSKVDETEIEATDGGNVSRMENKTHSLLTLPKIPIEENADSTEPQPKTTALTGFFLENPLNNDNLIDLNLEMKQKIHSLDLSNMRT